LEAHTQAKLYIVAGPEFGSREGNIIIIHIAIYGLKSSGLHWWERCSEILFSMGFHPSKAENDLWMKRLGNAYEYIARC